MVDVQTVGGALVLSRVGAGADAGPLPIGEPLEDVVVEGDEVVEQPAGGVQLQGEPCQAVVELTQWAPASTCPRAARTGRGPTVRGGYCRVWSSA